MGKLSIVATPIGNLEDITLRALRVLREVDVILAEDTRVIKKLLTHYDIKKPCERCDARAERASAMRAIERLKNGEHIALVTDAGTPGVSDPGAYLVRTVREALPAAKIEAIPGPSALSAALSIAGLPRDRFTFIGFLPHKKGRESAFAEIAEREEATIFYESTHRIMKTLESLKKHVGERRIIVLRELTKLFEEVVSGTPEAVIGHFMEDVKRAKGEFVVIVE